MTDVGAIEKHVFLKCLRQISTQGKMRILSGVNLDRIYFDNLTVVMKPGTSLP
jgi:hypothetical protein